MYINNIEVDKYQEQAIKSLKNTLLIAGAGAGKTFTIVGKINYLITHNIYQEKEILVISFTNKSVQDLKLKIPYSLDILTFHKLAMMILKDYQINYTIASDALLEYVTKEFFLSLNNESLQQEILLYYHEYTYDKFLNSSKFTNMVKIIINFIHLYKTNNLDIEIFKETVIINKFYTKLIILILNVYNEYLKDNNELDFDDLIKKATLVLDKFYKYKLIIIDEFQDTSFLRWNLVKKLMDLNQAKIFAVGDDYQSIYHFSGCNINLFLNFTSLVDDAIILKLKYTYRNSQELIDLAGKFISQNKKQITKSLISHKSIKNPLKIIYYLNPKEALEKVLKKLILKYNDILILERNNQDIDFFLNHNFSKEKDYLMYQNKKIRYLTVHSSKGLEAECVIVINLTNSLMGFPNQIIDEDIIKKVNDLKDNFLYAEERRLFYVALTRTKNEVYLLCPYFNKSIFVKEIKKYLN